MISKIKEFLHKNVFFGIILPVFISWKVLLLMAVYSSYAFLPIFGRNFFGGGYDNYNISPNIYGWANFDGEHFLSIALGGYHQLEQAFFPLYPGLMSLVLNIIPRNIYFGIIAGGLISNLAFLGALYFLYKLLREDYDQKFSVGVIVTLLLFPTSFYFNAVYSESLFLFLIVCSFYFTRKKNYWFAAVAGSLASATRVFGIFLLPALIIEVLQSKGQLKKAWPLLFIPSGLLFYMFYLQTTIGDPLAFYHLQLIVGQQHQSGIVLFPQVIVRYIKIFLSTDMFSFIYQVAILEFITGVLFFVLPIYGYFKKVRLSYLFFSLVCFISPTIQGSFSSTPRYVIVLFPMFICLYFLISKLPVILRTTIIVFLALGLIYETGLFLRGYWVA